MNPTTVQFMSALKKLLISNINVINSRNADCLPQDNTLMIGSTSLHKFEEYKSSSTCNSNYKKMYKPKI